MHNQIKQSQMNISKPRLPIDSRILNQTCCLLKRGPFSPFIDKTLECMCMLAFYGFLRCSEFTIRSLKAPYQFLRVRDVQFSQNKSMFTLFLASSKQIHSEKGLKFFIFRTISYAQSHVCFLIWLLIGRSLLIAELLYLWIVKSNHSVGKHSYLIWGTFWQG